LNVDDGLTLFRTLVLNKAWIRFILNVLGLWWFECWCGWWNGADWM